MVQPASMTLMNIHISDLLIKPVPAGQKSSQLVGVFCIAFKMTVFFTHNFKLIKYYPTNIHIVNIILA